MISKSNNQTNVLRTDASKPSWGLLPEDVLELLKVKYWQNTKKLKGLLSGKKLFPLPIHLKPPRGNAAIQNINHFQNFVSSWKSFSQDTIKNKGCDLNWEKRNFRSLAEQDVPTYLNILDIGSLACLLGDDAENQLQNWFLKIRYIFKSLSLQSNSHQALFQALIDHIEILDSFKQSDVQLLVKLIPQLQKGMGHGYYLRALPVTFVDTKFIEKNLRIIESVIAALVDSGVKETGLMRWLDCREKPKDWLLIKPLCEKTRALLGGLPLLRLSSDTLQDFELPASNILVIENEQCCLALGNVPDTIAVSGGGKNILWMKAAWLIDKNVGYWGDIDSVGLTILSDVRSKLSNITPLMMNELTVKTFAERMVPEPDSVSKDPIALTTKELALFNGLRANQYADKRLEQERLPMEYVAQNIDAWIVVPEKPQILSAKK